MPNECDYSAEPPGRDLPRGPSNHPAGNGKRDISLRRIPPGIIRAAGVLWIISGALLLAGAALTFLLLLVDSSGWRPLNGFGWILGCGAVCGVAFLAVGVQSFKGTATDTLASGIWSIVIALVDLGVALLLYAAAVLGGNVGLTPFAAVGSSPGLFLAGVLALLGRRSYKAYRQAGEERLVSDVATAQAIVRHEDLPPPYSQ